MNVLQVSRLARTLEKVFNYVADDNGTWVDSNGTETAVRFIGYDSGGVGLDIDSSGMRDEGARDLFFRKKDLTAWDITIDPTGYLIWNSERWDLMEKAAIQDTVIPLDGIHNFVSARFRKSVELNSAVSGNITFEE